MPRFNATRIAVLASSVLLAGGFVAYRAGAFDLTENKPQQMSSTKIMRITVPKSESAPPQAEAPKTIMGGTKTLAPHTSVPGLTPPAAQAPSPSSK